jgi:hypothetical protein
MSLRYPYLDWDTIRAHCFNPFHPFQCLSNLKFLDPTHEVAIAITKVVIQLKCCIPILPLNNLSKTLVIYV